MQQRAIAKSEDTDCDLMLEIQYNEENPLAANAALQELIRRHHEYFVRAIMQGLRWPDMQDSLEKAKELVMDAWLKLWDAAESYVGVAANDPVASRRAFRAWFFTLLKNHRNDQLKLSATKKLRDVTLVELNEADMRHSIEDNNAIESVSEKLEACGIENLFGCLSNKEASVLREYLLALGTEIITKQLPTGECDAIAHRLGTTKEAVRQLKSRAIRKIRAKYESLMEQPQ